MAALVREKLASANDEVPVLHLHVLETLQRQVDPEPTIEPTLRFIQCFTNFRALRPIGSIRAAVAAILRALPRDYVAVHIRQELDVLAISGCVGKDNPRYEEAEAVIRNWGGWDSSPLKGAREYRKRFGTTEGIERKGLCGVAPERAAVVLKAAGVETTAHARSACLTNCGC